MVHTNYSDKEVRVCYEEYIAIVHEYYNNSNFDSKINMDSRTKKKILIFEERSSYASLDVVREGRY